MKKLVVLLLLFLSIGLSWAQVEPLPNDSRFDSEITLVTQVDGQPLGSVIDGLARSMKLTPILSNIPDTYVFYNISDPKPFRLIWSILLTENGLDYVLYDDDVIVVGSAESIASSFKPPVAEPVEQAVDNNKSEDMAAPVVEAEPVVNIVYSVNNDPEEIMALVASVIPNAVVTAHVGLKTITVQGTAKEQEVAVQTLADFDKEIVVQEVPKEKIEQRIYTLSYANAADLVKVLKESGANNNFDPNANAANDAQNQDANTNAQSGSDLQISADERTNSIIITATHDTQERIAKLIPALDAPQKQVNVQVRIQEISTRSALDLGINLKGGLGNFSTSILDTGLQFIFDAQSALSGLNIGAVLDTLETQGLARRVDDTSLTVLNNKLAHIQSGGTIYILIPGSPPIERLIEYGVEVTVVPQITNDGKVNLTISAQVNQPLTDAKSINYVDIASRNIDSTITIEDGQTVLLGGLFQNSVVRDEKGVPILGAIPIIGSLFKQTSTEEKDSELLLIITADILD